MPETLHTREYYLEKAEGNASLHNAIAGMDWRFDRLVTFEGSLDCILAGLEEWSVSDFFKRADIREFRDYVIIVQEFLKDTGTQLDASPLCNDAIALGTYGRHQVMAPINGSVTVVCGILLVIPGGFLFDLGALALNGFLYATESKKVKAGKFVKDNREEVFAQLYDAARSLDHDIGRCFLLDHFRGAPKRFEQTYRSLSGEECEAIDAQLYALLEAGGMPGMDEQQLREYLSGLSEPEG